VCTLVLNRVHNRKWSTTRRYPPLDARVVHPVLQDIDPKTPPSKRQGGWLTSMSSLKTTLVYFLRCEVSLLTVGLSTKTCPLLMAST
jgi:hypothetical protein